MIATIEEISLNALPALQTFFYDGSIVRMSKGYSRRANSIQTYGLSQTFGLSQSAGLPQTPALPQTLGTREQTLDDKITYCEALYHQNNLPVIFKMTPASQPANLDQTLEARGYQIEGQTWVQTCELASFSRTRNECVHISETWHAEWFDEYCRMNKPNPAQRDTLKQLLQLILARTGFATLESDDGVCACGLGVLQENYIGLFDIVVDASARGQGYGKQLVAQLLSWGKTRGAQVAYLQVVTNNTSALRLYSQLGFVEQYQYWYRVRL